MPYKPSFIASFARDILGKPLYPYQIEIAEAILTSILEEQGRIFTVMLARQSGKNQLSAILEAFLLSSMPQGTIVKAAPTFTPQIINSRLRLLSMLENAHFRPHIWTNSGYIVGLTPQTDPALRRALAGPRVMFFSASPHSNVVGATADLLLEIDEAQDVSSQKFDRDFRPMAAIKNATTVLYGTAWTDKTLLAQQRAANLELEQRSGIRCHFEYDWRALAAINPRYRAYVENEIARLGEQNINIQTQYFLHPVCGENFFLSELQQFLLQGNHSWQDAPTGDAFYIAGMDIGGAARPTDPTPSSSKADNPLSSKRDSTVITIGRIFYNAATLPCVEIVHHVWWTGKPFHEQLDATIALAEHWNLRSLIVDATGLGANLASDLERRLRHERVSQFTFSRPSKSRLAYQLQALISSHRLKLYAQESAPPRVYAECWRQMQLARYRLHTHELMDIYVEPTEGHDDFLISLALLTEGLENLTSPAASTFVRPVSIYGEESRF